MSLIAQWSKNWAEKQKLPHIFYKSTTSTNDRAKEYFQQTISPSLFIAEFQTQGRGRKKKVWMNSDMMLSWSFFFNQSPQPLTTKLMGQALFLSLKRSWKNSFFDIKYPNDIYIAQKKLAGILVEVVNKGSSNLLVIGAGMNVFSSPVSSSFTYLQEHLEREITEIQWIFFMNEWKTQIAQKLPLCFQKKQV